MPLNDLGPDTVDLVFREPVTGVGGAPVLDTWGRPQRQERTVTRQRCSVQISDGTEEVAGATIAVLKMRALLPVDTDTEALTSADAIVYRGRRYELSMPGLRKEFLEGDPSHVRVAGVWAQDVSLGELVTVIPAGGRGDDGHFEPDGEPIDIIARAVFAGSSNALPLVASQSGNSISSAGELVTADYTVILDVDAPVGDGDWIIVRGRECQATVQRREADHPARRMLLVLAQYRAGAST